MDQQVSKHQNHRLPSADDICFLLSLVRNPNSFIAEHQQTTTPSSSVHKLSSSWQQTLTSLPGQRREIILALNKLSTARQKWNNVSKTGHEVNKLQQQYIEADVLEEVEGAAFTIRICSTKYLESIQDYIKSLQQQFWYDRSTIIVHKGNVNSSQLVNVGRQLSSQLISQLRWDERLMTHCIISYLNEELYNTNSNNDKLIIWSESMSNMMKIDKSYWSFVEREVYDETIEIDAEEDGKNSNRYLNGEHSTQYINVSSATLLEESQQNDGTTTENDRLHDCIVSSISVEEAVDAFFMNNSYQNRNSKCLTSILLVGEEGCGKTHLLNTIQQQYAQSNNIKILRPSREELIGNSIGSTEDRLIALFTYATRFIATASKEKGRKCLLMLDDIDRMFSLSDDVVNDSSDANVSHHGSTQHHYIGRRCKALFITMLDAFREHSKSIQVNGHLLLLCTSRSSCGEAVYRFDGTYTRGQQPDEKQRRQIICNCIYLENGQALDEDDETDIEEIVSLIVHHAAGRSAYELSQFCREAILSCAKSSTSQAKVKSNSTIFKERLQCLDKMLQTKSPQSVRGGLLDGVVDMTVLTPDELQSQLTIDSNGDVIMPLLGVEAKRAHEALMNVVITPLCRSDEIRTLLYGGGDEAALDSKPLRVGALLAGSPGVGKTSLAYHCAALAAMMSRISLLDVSCTSLIHKEMGGSERAVQHLFKAVRAAAPCIVLLDGIESVALRRGNDNTSEGTMDRVLSTFLTEMDGIETDISGNVAFIGITHNPDLIDPSLLRPGRLEKTITLQAPDYEARKELVSRQIQEIDFDFTSAGYFDAKTKDDISNYVAMSSAGMSAVEVIAICKEASMVCLRELNFEVTGKPRLTFDHFKNSISIKKGKAGGH